MPKAVRPMLATLVDQPFDRDGWIFEVKWDGYRIIAEVQGGKVRLYSRNGLDYTEKFPDVTAALGKTKHDAIFDGEIVVLDKDGRASFQMLQNYLRTGEGKIVFEAFDLLTFDGKDLRDLPLLERKKLLKPVLPKSARLNYVRHVVHDGKAFFAAAKERGLEGMIAKDGASPYREGVRGRQWLKVKTHARQEVVIGGFTEPQGSRKKFGALIVGVYEGGSLRYAGHVGGGFDAKLLAAVFAKLRKLERKTSPFADAVATNAPAHWVRPELVCEVQFAGWTGDGSMRQPVFMGLREDKPATDVVRESPQAEASASRGWPGAVKHEDKVYWPDEGYTKGDLVAYYRDVAGLLIPYLKDRPLSLNRHPDGITGESFFQKDVSALHLPPYVATTRIHLETEQKTILAPLCQNAKSLDYVVNLGCIEMNPWNSRRRSLDRADYLVIDLDPEDVPFAKVIDVAREVHRLFERSDTPNYCKTSGGRGLHIYVPLGAKYGHEEVRAFAEVVAALIAERMPGVTGSARKPSQRKGKVYIDALQNRLGATNVSAYSVRPRPRAPVSAPLRWSEVKAGLDPLTFTMKTMRRRIDRVGDLFAPVLGKGADLAEALKVLRRKL